MNDAPYAILMRCIQHVTRVAASSSQEQLTHEDFAGIANASDKGHGDFSIKAPINTVPIALDSWRMSISGARPLVLFLGY